jgi:carbon-monoxide dehydrogenase large subunit
MQKFVGQSIQRKEDSRLVTGSGHYVDDLRFADLLHVEILRSMYAHARVRSVDPAPARAVPGVVAVYTHADIRDLCGVFPIVDAGLKGLKGVKIPPRYPLADEEVCFFGQPIAAVVAENRYAARDAVDRIEVDYEPLPAVTDPERALEADSPRTHTSLPDNVAFRWEVTGGDLDAEFAMADRVIRQRFVNQRLAPCAMEPRGVVASWLAGDEELTVWTSTQIPHVLRAQLALALKLSETAVRVVAPEVGGGFGSKRDAYVEEALLSVIARLLAPRPVKWIETRRENLAATVHGRGQVGNVEVAVRNDGRLLGIRYDALADLGAYHQLFTPTVPTLTGTMLCGAYQFPAARMSVTGVFTNKMSTGSYRGAGRSEATFIIERALDIVAAELELDPVEVRRVNFLRSFPLVTPTGGAYDTGDYGKALDALLDLSDIKALRAEREKRRRQGELVGIGFSTYVEICAMGPSKAIAAGGWESARVRVSPTGKVDVYTGTCSSGQGQETSFAQIVADTLGVTPDDVRVRRGDTAQLSDGTGTFGSRSAAVGGAAVFEAASRVQQKMKRIAAGVLGVPDEYLEQVGDRFVAGDNWLTHAEVCFHAYRGAALPEEISPGLEETVFFEPKNFTFPFGAHVCFVAVDRETGETRVEKYYAVDDCGKVINPLLVAGQVHGGIAQGLGQALLEGAIYDGAGQLLTGTLMDYAIPKATHLPWFHCARTETPTDVNPLGVKGVGEAGTVGSTPAIVNAVVDALTEFRVKHIDMPITAEKVWRLIRDSRSPLETGSDA